jgi:hypothetical protein
MATSIMSQTSPCECTQSRQGLIPIPVGGPLTKYQVCPRCGKVWVERYRIPEGQPESVMDFDMEDPLVPAAVREQVRALIGPMPRHSYRSSRERMFA